jgi:hypothetical protein
MRRIVLMVFASVLVFSLGAAAQDTTVAIAPSTPAGAAPDPPAPAYKSSLEFPLRVSASYQFTEFRNMDGMTFHQNGINTDFTGFLGHDFALEGDVAAGFGYSRYSTTVNLESSEIFYGGGIRIGPERNVFQPWGHVLLGGEHFRFSQRSPALGIDNGFAYQLGLGADIKIGPRAFWRVEGEYLGTHMFSNTQANYQFGTGIAFAF